MFPEVTSARIIICTWCMVCLIMTAVYTGNLVAFAAVDKHKPPFTTLMELAELDHYKVGVVAKTYIHDVLMVSNDETYQAISWKLKPIETLNRTYLDLIDHSLRRLLEGNYVWMDVIEGNSYIMSKTCEVVEMKEKVFSMHGGFIYPRHSPMRKLFDTKLFHLRDLGLIDKLIRDWGLKSKICAKPENIPKFSLKNLSTVLVTCSTGIVLAVLVLIFETWKKK